MNFDHMPELHWHYGYYIVLGIMALMTIQLDPPFKSSAINECKNKITSTQFLFFFFFFFSFFFFFFFSILQNDNLKVFQ